MRWTMLPIAARLRKPRIIPPTIDRTSFSLREKAMMRGVMPASILGNSGPNESLAYCCNSIVPSAVTLSTLLPDSTAGAATELSIACCRSIG